MSFAWVPRTLIDESALLRLGHYFPKPDEPPPEAWFMGEISYYPSIIEDGIEDMPLSRLEWYLRDTSSGLRIFTEVEFAQNRWRETFHYLLPHLIKRCNEASLLSDTIAYFFHIYEDTIPNIYPGYRSDILNTLGKAIMSESFWGVGDLSKTIIQYEWDIYHLYGSNDFTLTLSAALYFCLKYLTPSEINIWTESLLQIDGRYWHFSFMNWLFQETFQLLSNFDRDDLIETQLVKPAVGIGVNVSISEFQLPTANVKAFIAKLKEHDVYLSLSTK